MGVMIMGGERMEMPGWLIRQLAEAMRERQCAPALGLHDDRGCEHITPKIFPPIRTGGRHDADH